MKPSDMDSLSSLLASNASSTSECLQILGVPQYAVCQFTHS